MAKAAFNKKKAVFKWQIGLKFKIAASEMLHLEHTFVWCWRRMEKIVWTDRVRN